MNNTNNWILTYIYIYIYIYNNIINMQNITKLKHALYIHYTCTTHALTPILTVPKCTNTSKRIEW